MTQPNNPIQDSSISSSSPRYSVTSFSRSIVPKLSFLSALLFLSPPADCQSTNSQSCSCTDVPPSSNLTCAEQRDFGKCNASWITAPRPEFNLPEGYCQTTCGRCGCSVPRADSDQCLCDDVPPPGEFTCAQQRQFGKCQEEWMRQAPTDSQLKNGYCAQTCGRCVCLEPDQVGEMEAKIDDCDCTDVPPPSEEGYSCEDQRRFGKCTSNWMRTAQENLPEGYCQWTCGFCPCIGAPQVDITNRPVFLGDVPCTCSDYLPPNSEFTCVEQKQLGKCLADWMRNPGDPDEGYCQITCGLCPCSNPTIEGPRPESIPSLTGATPGQTIPLNTSASDQILETVESLVLTVSQQPDDKSIDEIPSITPVDETIDVTTTVSVPIEDEPPITEPAEIEPPITEVPEIPDVDIPIAEIPSVEIPSTEVPEAETQTAEVPSERMLPVSEEPVIGPDDDGVTALTDDEFEPAPEVEDDVVKPLDEEFEPIPEPEDDDESLVSFDDNIEPTPEVENDAVETLDEEFEPIPEPEDDDESLVAFDDNIEPTPEVENDAVETLDEEFEPIPEPEDDDVITFIYDDIEPVSEPQVELPEAYDYGLEEIETSVPSIPIPEPEIIDFMEDLDEEPETEMMISDDAVFPEEEPTEERPIEEELDGDIPITEIEGNNDNISDSLDAPLLTPSIEPDEETILDLDRVEPSSELLVIPTPEPDDGGEDSDAGLIDRATLPTPEPVMEPEENGDQLLSVLNSTIEEISPKEEFIATPTKAIFADPDSISQIPADFSEEEAMQLLQSLDVKVENVNDYEDPLPQMTSLPELEEIREQEPIISFSPKGGRRLLHPPKIKNDIGNVEIKRRNLHQLLLDNRTSALFDGVEFLGGGSPSPVISASFDIDISLPLSPAVESTESEENSLPCNSIERLLASPLGTSQFGILGTLIKKSGLLEELRSPNLQSTMFVAMDSAFDQMPKTITLEQLQNDNSIRTINYIRKLILFNIVPGIYRAKDFRNNLVLETLYGSPVSAASGVNNSVGEDITTVKIISRGGSWFAVGGPWSARIEIPDIGLCGSVVHLVNRVLWPPDDFTFLPTDESGKSCNTITGLLESVVGITHFSILGKLLKKAGLEDELRNPTLAATIFAPVDSAFLNLPEPYTVDRLLSEDSPKVINELQKLLLFHVVPGRVGTEDFTDDLPLVTFLASFYTLVNKQGELVVKSDSNGTIITTNEIEARVIVPDVGVCQSIIHWIDAVLIPTWNDAVVEVLTKNQTQHKNKKKNDVAPIPLENQQLGFFSPSTLERYALPEPVAG